MFVIHTTSTSMHLASTRPATIIAGSASPSVLVRVSPLLELDSNRYMLSINEISRILKESSKILQNPEPKVLSPGILRILHRILIHRIIIFFGDSWRLNMAITRIRYLRKLASRIVRRNSRYFCHLEKSPNYIYNSNKDSNKQKR